jgi:hypothetical protein
VPKYSLSKEIFLILLVKILLLYILWASCFKSSKPYITNTDFSQAVFGNYDSTIIPEAPYD